MFSHMRFLLSTCLIFTLMNPDTTPAQSLTTDQLREDLSFLVETLKGVHPNPFHRIPEAEFDAAVNSLDRELGSITREQVAVRMMALVAMIHDGHTSLLPRNLLRLERWYPVRMDRFEDGIFIIATDTSYENLLGREVINIAGRPALEVWNTAQTISPGDNVFSSMGRTPLPLMIPEVLKGLGINDGGDLMLDMASPSGKQESVRVETIAIEPGLSWYYRGDAPGESVSLTFPGGDLPFQHIGDYYWYHLDAASGMLYAQINAIQDAPEPVYMNGENRKLSLPEFSKEIVQVAVNENVQKLVIDIRWNGGGNNFLARPLVDAIAAQPAVNQRGRLFVITGRKTYSAAMNLTSMLESRTNALFVGEPPGGAPLHYGDATGFSLPNSGASLNVSTLHWDLGVEPLDVREVMEPHMPITPQFSAFKAGRDPALDAIRNYAPDHVLSERLMSLYRKDGMEATLNAYMSDRGTPTAPWGTQAQQLIAFGWELIRADASGEDIYRAFRFATEQYPDAPETWFTLGRIYAYPGRWKEAAEAHGKAYERRPTNDLIRRFLRAAEQKQ